MLQDVLCLTGYNTFHHIQYAGLQENSVAFGRRQSHGFGRLQQMQHVSLRTEVELRSLFLHIYMNTMNTAPYTLRGEKERKGS